MEQNLRPRMIRIGFHLELRSQRKARMFVLGSCVMLKRMGNMSHPVLNPLVKKIIYGCSSIV
ncbi:U1 putative protein [Burg el Arab virus]|uniref:Uncharacterized protein n=1 Tax=Burg el Arab virus TaxID=2686073 RepID=A0AAE8XC79_9RHAB|nr:U1 putative protein [Burg el Arab virus]UAU42895.1 U1 putative protein [Burg el Arab virus]